MKIKTPESLNVSRKRRPRVQREIVTTLACRILSGEIQPSEYLPKESELCVEYGVSRLDFHTALLVASHNHVLVQLASVIRAALRALFELTNSLGSAHEQALHLHGAVVEAVRLRQPELARAAILKILDAAVTDLRVGGRSFII
jgi:DNA-binding FadR family transcriptional regulator